MKKNGGEGSLGTSGQQHQEKYLNLRGSRENLEEQSKSIIKDIITESFLEQEQD